VPGDPYTRITRFTDPGEHAALLESLPETVTGICGVAEQQTIHHNLLGWFGIDRETAHSMRRVWPPRLRDILGALAEIPPGNLIDPRPPQQRVVGACMLESHLLAGLLRSRGIATRVRAGYFQGIREHGEHIVRFWRSALAARGVGLEEYRADPAKWTARLDTLSRARNAADHHIEHWICEYRQTPDGEWRLADANRSFLLGHSGLEVDYQLPAQYFEHAHAAWRALRRGGFDPEQYVEDEQDGSSHVRSQLLWDFYSLLGHDLAGFDEPDESVFEFVKLRTYRATGPAELAALDALADLLATDPPAARLAAFYRATPALQSTAVETDPHSLVFGGGAGG
jgi:hypothetical protein